jgi:hypothetical protein
MFERLSILRAKFSLLDLFSVRVTLDKGENLMRTKARLVTLPFVLVILVLLVLLFSTSNVSADPSPANYRVPVIGSYKITRLDANAGCVNPFHYGNGRYMDINGWGGGNTDLGDPVYAAGAGTVDIAPYHSEYGNNLTLESGGVTFRYAHLFKIHVNDGAYVSKGDLLGFVGKSGLQSVEPKLAHIHWEAWLTASGADFDIFSIPGVDTWHTPCVDDSADKIGGPRLDENHVYHPESSPEIQGCPNFYNTYLSLWNSGVRFVTLFDHKNCDGNLAYLYEPGEYNLDGQYNFDDRMRSISVPPGWSVKLYASTDNNVLVSSCFTKDYWDLEQDSYVTNTNMKIGWDEESSPSNNAANMVSRVRVYNNTTCTEPYPFYMVGLSVINVNSVPNTGGIVIGGTGGNNTGPVMGGDEVTIHEDPNYGAQEYGWHDPVSQNIVDYMSNKTSAVGLNSGWSVALFDGANQTGPFICVTQTDSDLSDNVLSDGSNANDRAESVIVFHDSNCSGMSKPDLVAEEVFVSLTTGTTTDDILNTGEPAYIDWHFKNAGNTSTSGQFYVDVWVEDYQAAHYPQPSIAPGQVGGFDDWMEIIPDNGWLKVKVVVDPDNVIDELDEQNNVWEKWFFWYEPYVLTSADCDVVTETGVLLIDNTNCNGEYERKGLPGTSNLSSLDNKASSLWVYPGLSVMVYKDVNVNGQKACFSDYVENLNDFNWADGSNINDSISSYEVFFNEFCITQGSSAGQLVLYGGANHTSSATSFELTGPYNVPSNVDNSISSLVIASGWSVRLYDGYNQYGSSVCMNADDLDFANNTYDDGVALNDSVSSLELFDETDCGGVPPTPTSTPMPTPASTPTSIPANGCGGAVTLDGVVLYSDSNCGGTYVQLLVPGSLYNLGVFGFNDVASSASTRNGMSVMVYKDTNLSGESRCLSWDYWNLYSDTWSDGTSMNESISSMQVFDNTSCQGSAPSPTPTPTPSTYPLYLYEHADFGGTQISFSTTGVFNLYGFNDMASSGSVSDGWSVRLYEHGDLGGDSVCMSSDNVNFNDGDTFDGGTPLNDRVSSVEVFNDGNCGASAANSVIIYESAYFSYNQYGWNSPGLYDMPSAMNDRASSIQIASGWSVLLFEHGSQQGASICLSADENDFQGDTYSNGYTGLNDSVSSIHIFDNSNCQ